jgi:hypothetical protein
LNNLLPIVKEGNISAEELKRKISFEPVIVNEPPDQVGLSPLEEIKNSKSKVKIKVTNKEDGTNYFWDPDKFTNRLFMIRDLMDEYFENNGKIPDLDQETDPFWDPEEPVEIGRGYLYLKALGYLLDSPNTLKLINISSRGDFGTLDVDVKPTDETGEAEEAPDEILPEEPEDLIGKRIDFNIVVNKANNLPDSLCKDTFVKYGFYLDRPEQTKTIAGTDSSPTYNYKHHYTIDCVTEDMIKYFNNDAICFKVFGLPTSMKVKKAIQKEQKAKEQKEKLQKQETIKKYKGEDEAEVKEVKKSGCCTIF